MSSSVTREAAWSDEPPRPADDPAEPRTPSVTPPDGPGAPTPRRRGALLVRCVLAALSGVLLYLSFPPRPPVSYTHL